MLGETGVVAESPQFVCFGTGLVFFEFGVGHILGLHLLQFFMDGVAYLVIFVAGERDGVEGEQAGVFIAGEAAEALGEGGDLLVYDEALVEA